MTKTVFGFLLTNALFDCMYVVGADYCFLPTSRNMDPSLIRSGPGACSPTSKCELCEGDYDEDEDCQGNLQCFHRHSKEAVPGCRGGEYDRSCTYCLLLLIVSFTTAHILTRLFFSARLLCESVSFWVCSHQGISEKS